MNSEERQVEALKELWAVYAAQQAAIEALGQEASALGLSMDAPPSLEQVEAATPPEVLAAVRDSVLEAESVLAGFSAPAAQAKTKTPRKMRDTI